MAFTAAVLLIDEASLSDWLSDVVPVGETSVSALVLILAVAVVSVLLAEMTLWVIVPLEVMVIVMGETMLVAFEVLVEDAVLMDNAITFAISDELAEDAALVEDEGTKPLLAG